MIMEKKFAPEINVMTSVNAKILGACFNLQNSEVSIARAAGLSVIVPHIIQTLFTRGYIPRWEHRILGSIGFPEAKSDQKNG